MPTIKDYMDAWIDGMFSAIGAVRKPVEIISEDKKQQKINSFEVQSILSNIKKNAFTVVWTDGTYTTVHCQPGDEWDDEKALAMCFTKKALGNSGNFNNKFNDALNNKMKVIPAEPAIKMSDSSISFTRPITLNEEAVEKMIEAPEKACNCDGKKDHDIHSCTECKCKEEKRHGAISDESLAAEHADPDAKRTENEDSAPYKVYIKINGDSYYDSEHYTISSLEERIYKVAERLLDRKPSYYRTWMISNNRMQVDFGHYLRFIEVEGITPEEYAKN